MQNIKEKIKPTLNKVLSFLLLVGIAVSSIQSVRAESLSEFLQGFLQPANQTEESPPPAAQTIAADKSSYAPPDIIKISNVQQGSAIKIYWLDNPDTALNPDPDSRPANVYAVMAGDDGAVNIDAATLAPGNYVLVNTFEPEHCSGFYLSQCQARSDYLGEVSISIGPYVMAGDDGAVNIDAATLAPGNYVLVNTFEPEHCSGFYLSQCQARSDYLGEVSISIGP